MELKDIQAARVRTKKLEILTRQVLGQSFNPRRREICQQYLAAIREEMKLTQEYTQETGSTPIVQLPFEYYYLYYIGTPKEYKWKQICSDYVERMRENEKNVEKC